MARPPGSSGAETRERILDAAQELFTDRGYDKTSLRDIAERLQITKAALYYYFPRKEDILIELHRRIQTLGASVLDELEAAPDGAARIAIWPRLTDEIIDFMVDNRELMLLHNHNRTAFAGIEQQLEPDGPDVEERFQRILASPDMSLAERVRMAAMLGAITEVFAANVQAFEDAPVGEVADTLREALAGLMPAATAARGA